MKHRSKERIRRSPEEIQALLKAFDSQEVSARQFAKQHQISPGSFRNWLQARRSSKAKGPRWVEVISTSVSPAPVVTVEIFGDLKVHLSSGFAAGPVAELIRQLRQP